MPHLPFCATLIGILFPVLHHGQATQPNIIFFIIDDMPFVNNYIESAPDGVNLNGEDVVYGDYPTPNINAFRNESVIFPKSYCGGPKCAPSRFSLLTGRQPARNEWAVQLTLVSSNGSTGTDVSVFGTKFAEGDSVNNLPRVLQDNGYSTGMVGKWHLMTNTDNGLNLGCEALDYSVDAVLYANCTAILQDQGFGFVDGFYFSNIDSNEYFSHNPEWMVSRAQAFIDEAVDDENNPFFLYFASTLTHSPDVYEALHNYSYTATPKGTLSGDDIPDDTTMRGRSRIWTVAENAAGSRRTTEVKTEYAEFLWVDEQFGALIDYLETKGIYDETLIVVQNDHGMSAKGMLYEQGSRIFNFVRYPPLFGTDQTVLSDDFVVSNVDLAATIFDLLDITAPDNYTMDGVSWLDEVISAVDGTDTDTDGSSCCEYRYVDIRSSRSIVSSKYQYIWRADDDVETAGNVDDLYVSAYEREQLYDLEADPSEQINLITFYESYRSDDGDASLSDTIGMFQSMMRDYVNATSPMEQGQCDRPSMMFCSETITWSNTWTEISRIGDTIKSNKMTEAEETIAEDYPDCVPSTSFNYAYAFTYLRARERLTLDMEICCGDDKPVFPGSHVLQDGYEYSFAQAFSVTEVTWWEENMAWVIGVVAGVFCCVVTILVAGLLVERRKRKKVEREAAEIMDQEKQGVNMAGVSSVTSAKSAGDVLRKDGTIRTDDNEL